MSAGDYVKTANTADLADAQTFIVANNLTALRAWLSNAKRQLTLLTKTLNDYRQIGNSEKRENYRYSDAELDQISADRNMTVTEIQARDYFKLTKNPDSSIAYAKNRAEDNTTGIKEMKAHELTIDDLIQSTNSKIREYEQVITKVQTIIDENASGLAEDRIYRTRLGGYNQLYSLHLSYRMMTTYKGQRPLYPENDAKTVLELIRMKALFVAQANQYQELITQGLELDDIGSDKNNDILKKAVGIYVASGTVGAATTVAVEATTKFLSNLQTVIQDQSFSKNISRKPLAQLDPVNSMKTRTESYPFATANLWGEINKGTDWSLPSLKDSVEKWWKGAISKNFQSLPKCPKPSNPPSEADTKKALSQAQVSIIDTIAADNFSKKQTAAKTVSTVSSSDSLATINASVAQVKTIMAGDSGKQLPENDWSYYKIRTPSGIVNLSAYYERDKKALELIQKYDTDALSMVQAGTLTEGDRLRINEDTVGYYQSRWAAPQIED